MQNMTGNSVSIEFTKLLTNVQRALYGYILSLLANKSDAEDILQETNLILCSKAHEFNPEGHFQAWAFNIARFQVMKYLTNNKRSRILLSNETIDAMAADDFDTEKVQLIQKALLRCYDLLPEHMHQIARLRFREELNLKDISERVKRPLGSISATLHRIRQNRTKCVQNERSIFDQEVDF